MIILHNLKGGISGQVFKDFLKEDIKLLASNILQTSGTQWQTVIKFRSSGIGSVPIVYGFGLNLHDSAIKEPYTFELSEAEAKGKLRAWGYSAVEIDKLVNLKMEAE